MNVVQNVYEKIENVVGTKFVSDSKPIRYSYSMNCDFVLQEVPSIVVKPKTAEEVSEILKIANEFKIKVIPRGNGADLTGGAKPIGPDESIVLDVTRMNKILDIDEENRIVTVEVGISWSELNEQLRHVGIGFYTGNTGPASGFSATIGGGLSNNSVGGGGAAMYGNATEQCVGLEVVLPTGEIIYTGAKANSFCEKPFTRFGLGPDYSGLFLGDVGIHAIKTKASMKIYPLPEYVGYAAYDVPNSNMLDSAEKVKNVMLKWQHERLPLHDFFYYSDGTGFAQNLTKAKITGGLLLYTSVADSQQQLDYFTERIEKIAKDAEFKKMGPTVSEGNLGKWFYEEDGKWQWANHSWLGGSNYSMSGCMKCPTYELPKYMQMYNEWNIKNIPKIMELGATGGAGFIAFGVSPTYIDVAGGLGIMSEVRHKEAFEKIWKDHLGTLIKNGAIHYWMGEIIGRTLVDTGALSEEYYNFMLTIKKALDPNKILSPGKFYLGDKY
jgi:FAD/FMN-containing dehydrogenase